MGLSIFSRSCSTNYTPPPPPRDPEEIRRERAEELMRRNAMTVPPVPLPERPAPNPNPQRWTLLEEHSFEHGYVLIVQYHDCTNFEGVKCMVYRGKFYLSSAIRHGLDPHFTNAPDAPIARFRPDEAGIRMAKSLAMSLDHA